MHILGEEHISRSRINDIYNISLEAREVVLGLELDHFIYIDRRAKDRIPTASRTTSILSWIPYGSIDNVPTSAKTLTGLVVDAGVTVGTTVVKVHVSAWTRMAQRGCIEWLSTC